eukprot:scaffold1655_cov247-Pinguiococcus_pyrenoidosus.AAC.24
MPKSTLLARYGGNSCGCRRLGVVGEEILEMIEPNPEADLDGWAAWYETLSSAVTSLTSEMDARHIKPAREAAL